MGETLTMPGPPPAPLRRLLTPAAARGLSPSCHGPPRSSPHSQVPGSLFPACTPGPPSARTLTQTLVGGLRCAPRPRAVLEEGQAALTVGARGVVLASADQPALGVRATRAGVSVTLAPGEAGRTGRTGLSTRGRQRGAAPRGRRRRGSSPKPCTPGGPLLWLHDGFY